MFRVLGSLVSVLLALAAVSAPRAESPQGSAATASPTIDVTKVKTYGTHFQTSDRCVACHNGLTTPSGEDISIGVNWRTSMMGNSGRDPYWMAGVRRELIDHPAATVFIQDECTICHMPMMRYEAKLAGGEGQAFAHLPPDLDKLDDRLADEGVSCTVCHQIADVNFGTRASFVGGFKIDEKTVAGQRHVFGPFEIDKGHTTVMHSSSTFKPQEGKHIRPREVRARCHRHLRRALD